MCSFHSVLRVNTSRFLCSRMRGSLQCSRFISFAAGSEGNKAAALEAKCGKDNRLGGEGGCARAGCQELKRSAQRDRRKFQFQCISSSSKTSNFYFFPRGPAPHGKKPLQSVNHPELSGLSRFYLRIPNPDSTSVGTRVSQF